MTLAFIKATLFPNLERSYSIKQHCGSIYINNSMIPYCGPEGLQVCNRYICAGSSVLSGFDQSTWELSELGLYTRSKDCFLIRDFIGKRSLFVSKFWYYLLHANNTRSVTLVTLVPPFSLEVANKELASKRVTTVTSAIQLDFRLGVSLNFRQAYNQTKIDCFDWQPAQFFSRAPLSLGLFHLATFSPPPSLYTCDSTLLGDLCMKSGLSTI